MGAEVRMKSRQPAKICSKVKKINLCEQQETPSCWTVVIKKSRRYRQRDKQRSAYINRSSASHVDRIHWELEAILSA